jgi:hypothetical protein
VGEQFTSFDDAWSSFLARTEPLESFFDEFPDDPAVVADAWLIVPPPEVKREALRVEGVLEGISGLRIVPHHFLHVSLRGTHGPDLEQLLALGPFELRIAKLNCLNTAVVAEGASEELDRVDAPETFLPHLSLAYVETPIAADPVREALLSLREASIGTFVVSELLRVRMPAGRTTVLEPWTVVERASLRR